MALNIFRTFVLAAIALIAWYAFFSEHSSERARRAPVVTQAYCQNTGQIALTFDEGPSGTTQNVLVGLTAAKLQATFHVVTKYFAQDVFTVISLEQALKAGHVIGLRFPAQIMPNSMSDGDFVKMLLEESEALFQAVGKYPKFLRLPFGGYDAHHVGLAADQGFVVSTWNIDAGDYSGTADSVAKVYSDILSRTPAGASRFIALHHDMSPIYQDQGILSKVAAAIRDNGYTPVTLDKCLNIGDAYRATNVDLRAGAIAVTDSSVSSTTSTIRQTNTPATSNNDGNTNETPVYSSTSTSGALTITPSILVTAAAITFGVLF